MSDLAAQQQLVAALRGVLGAQLIETHISWVLLAGDLAWKIKKAVNLGFLDFSTLEARRFYCEEEIRLNRRLAPQLYLEAVPIGGSAGQPLPGQTPAIEYAVKMQRFAADSLFDQLVAKNKITPQDIDALAALLAGFHHALPPAPPGSSYGSPGEIRAEALQNFEQMQPLLEGADLLQLEAIRQLTLAEYSAHEKDFSKRHAQGFIRECHGDLHLGNIALIQGRPVPFDGIEFNADLRWQDIMSEAAFPVMDLLQHRQPALAFRLLNGWLEAGGDYEGLCLVRFYLAYRAMVRAKINAIRAAQPHLRADARQTARAACRSYMELARHALSRRHPALILTHGLPGSGKTTFAQLALERYGAIRVRSDVERKRLFGLAPLQSSRAGADIYGQEATRRTYARLRDVARSVLDAGFPVIVDAAFLRHGERQHFRALAQEMRVPFAIAALHAPQATLHARIAKRQHDASEADISVLNMLQAAQEPLGAEERNHAVEFSGSAGRKGFGAQPWARLERVLAWR